MKNFRFIMPLVAFLLLFGSVSSFAAAPNEPVVAHIKGSKVYSTDTGVVQLCFIDRNVSGQTQFGSSGFFGRGNDIYNQGWKVYALEGCSNVSAGTLVDITDFVSSTGTFTTVAAGASWATGDRVLLVFGSLARDLEGSSGGGLAFTGLVTTASTTVPAVTDFIGLGDDRFNDNFYMEVTADIDGACIDQVRKITDFVSSTGVITLSSALGSAVDVGDRVTIFHKSQLNWQGSVSRSTATLPQGTTQTLFTAINGAVWLTSITGEVTVVIGGTTTNIKLSVFKGSTTTDISANVDTNADAVGTVYNITGTLANATVVLAPDTPKAGQQAGKVFIPDGATIIYHASSSTTGSIAWTATYEAEEAGASLRAN